LKAKVRITNTTKRVRKAAESGNIKSLNRAAPYIRGVARKMIKKSPEPSAPGKPPHTRQGRLKNAIFYSLDRKARSVVIGPTATGVGLVGHTHEFGGKETARKVRRANWQLRAGGHGPIRINAGKPVIAKLTTARMAQRATELTKSIPASQGGSGNDKPRNYPARPFMGPALTISKSRLPSFWRNSVKGA